MAVIRATGRCVQVLAAMRAVAIAALKWMMATLSLCISPMMLPRNFGISSGGTCCSTEVLKIKSARASRARSSVSTSMTRNLG